MLIFKALAPLERRGGALHSAVTYARDAAAPATGIARARRRVMTATITIDTLDGSDRFSAYIARPQAEPKAAIVVIQEIFGVNAGIRRKCDTLAEAGYLAIAPDLFWRIEPGVELDPDLKPEFDRALELMGQFDQDKGVADIEATIRTARAMCDGGKVGVVGYCLGGRLAFMTAARTDVDASVGYYGVGIDGLLGEKHAIAHAVLLHIPQEDHFVDKTAQAAMHAGLDDHPKVTLHDYPGEDHGFATEFGTRRSDASAKLADARTAAFFAEHLG
jgi:carboxymethylenebutenolidase